MATTMTDSVEMKEISWSKGSHFESKGVFMGGKNAFDVQTNGTLRLLLFSRCVVDRHVLLTEEPLLPELARVSQRQREGRGRGDATTTGRTRC